MKILFRVDAGGELGLGHYYRSFALAKSLVKNGHEIIFIHLQSDFWESEKIKGFPFQNFEINPSDQLNELLIIKDCLIDLFYVDGVIEFDSSYIAQIKKYVKIVFYQNISDSRQLSDIFILPSIHQQNKFFDKFHPSTKIYQGLKYFTFHNKVISLKKKGYIDYVKNIGIIAGGSDPKNTMKIIQGMLDCIEYKDLNFTFYYGSDYKYLTLLKKYKAKHLKFKYNQFEHQDILKNDLLISAFGVSTYEFMALGMPILSYGHQKANAQALDYLAKHTQALISIGHIDELNNSKLRKELTDLINNQSKRNNLANLAKMTVDFEGINRIMKIIENEKQ
jgi:spore coat polysaccharide biosynthesis predicted glycosyltransferase SpsG